MSGKCKDCKHYVTLWKYLFRFPYGQSLYHKCGKFIYCDDVGGIWGRLMYNLNTDSVIKCQYFINKRNK
jgi:hypothetical protein